MDRSRIPENCGKYEIIEMSDGAVIKHDDQLHTFNATGIEILRLCDGKRSIHDIIDVLNERYEHEDIEGIIDTFFEQLDSLGIL